MHPKLEHHLREQLGAVLAEFELTEEGDVDTAEAYLSVNSVVKTLAGSTPFKDHISTRGGESIIYALLTEFVAQLPEMERKPGSLSEVLLPEEATAVIDNMLAWLKGVPRQYEYHFLMSGLTRIPTPLSLGNGVSIRREPWPAEYLSKQESSAQRNLIAKSLDDKLHTLCVRSSGIAVTRQALDSAAARALFTGKVALTLGTAFGLFRSRYFFIGPSSDKARVFQFMEGKDPVGANDLLIPGSFFKTLGSLSFLWRGSDASKRAVDAATEISKVVNRLRHVPTNSNPPDHDADHANRIATAAIWLHDARSGEQDASRVVRTSIAIEALYGGSHRDSVGATLRNRLAYALAKSPSERAKIGDQFDRFYDMRSDVVHRGHIQ